MKLKNSQGQILKTGVFPITRQSQRDEITIEAKSPREALELYAANNNIYKFDIEVDESGARLYQYTVSGFRFNNEWINL